MKKVCNIKPFLGLSNSMSEDNMAVSSSGAKTVTTIIHSGSSSRVIRDRTSELGEPQTQGMGRVITNPLDTRPDMVHYHHPQSLNDEHYEVVKLDT